MAPRIIRRPNGEPEPNPSGMCHCGCGEKTLVSDRRRVNNGIYYGEHLRFINGHNGKGMYGEKASGWKGGRAFTGGYISICVRGHPNANHRGRILEHRYVMSEHLGRPLYPNETIHHLNGVRHDNRIENLEVRVGKHGKGFTHCPHCGESLFAT